MQLTNNYTLPEPLVSAIKNDSYDKVGDRSATALIKPVQIYELEKRHDTEIIVDAADLLHLLMGKSIHNVLEKADTSNHLAEERMFIDVLGWKISAKPDLLDSNGILSDYKYTSVWAFILGNKPEWEAQLNIYRLVFEDHGFPVNKLQIVAILDGWSRRQAKLDPAYPQKKSLTVEIPMWPTAKTRAYLEERVRLHQLAENLPDNKLPECSPAERWARPTTYAVKKEENKKAFRVFENPETAAQLATEKGMIVEVRPGENVRCDDFCLVRQWCNQVRVEAITH